MSAIVLSTSHNVLDAMEADENEVGEHSRRHVRAFVAAARSGRPPTGEELAFVRQRGAQRARELLPLAAVLQSYLLGQRLMWEAVVERAAGDEPAALALTAATFE